MKVEIIEDSINDTTNDRFTTFIVTFPRFINSELLRHRAFSFCSASTRAIPTKKIIQSVIDDPAMPVFWGKNIPGMQANEELDDVKRSEMIEEIVTDGYYTSAQPKFITSKEKAKYFWLKARDEVIKYTEKLVELGLHKQISGRILEAWFNITVLISGTEWENFFALRAHPAAQPEIRDLAYLMLEEYNKSIPKIKKVKEINYPYGEYKLENFIEENSYLDWHLPFGDKMPKNLTQFEKIKVSCARVARLSYQTFDGEIDVEKDFAIYDKLLRSSPIHASPAEAIAFPVEQSKFFGNLKGWCSFRKLIPNETSKDERVIKRKVINGVVI